MTTPYPLLFSPITIGGLELRNRVVQLPMGLRMAQDGMVSARDVEFHRERAAGVGLVVVGGTLAHHTTVYRPRVAVEAFDPAAVEGMAARAAAIKAAGAAAFVQLHHLGRDMHGQTDTAPVAPSAIASPRDLVVPRELSAEDIADITTSFGRSAEHVRMAGYDGIEVQAAHGYLVAQFLSAGTNRRDDAYGGALDGRMRFLLGLLATIRERCGDDCPLGVRLSAEEGDPGGLDLDATLAIVERLQEHGLVDYVSITLGMRNDYVKDTTAPEGVALGHAAAVRRVCDVPVIAAGRIRDPELAEAALRRGDADLVGVGRALIADPRWAAKAHAGRAEEIRPCIGFVQDCRLSAGGVTCAVNARAGREVDWGPPARRAGERRRVVVVGAGPGGLESARLAAEDGHDVVLFERTEAPGGQLRLAARAPHRAELADLVRHLEREVRRLGVDLRLGVAADERAVLDERPDAVLVATGATPRPWTFPVHGGADVRTVWQLLAGAGDDGDSVRGGRAVVLDDGTGFWPGVSAAELLAARGLRVELLTPARAVALAIPHESSDGVHRRLRAAGVRFQPFTRIAEVEGERVRTVDVLTGASGDLRADLVAVVTHLVAADGLLRALRGRVPALAAVGDCSSPRRLSHAVLDANLALRALADGRLGPAALPLG